MGGGGERRGNGKEQRVGERLGFDSADTELAGPAELVGRGEVEVLTHRDGATRREGLRLLLRILRTGAAVTRMANRGNRFSGIRGPCATTASFVARAFVRVARGRVRDY